MNLTRVEGHLQLSLEDWKCDGLGSVSKKYFILIKIQRFKVLVIKYSEYILLIENGQTVAPKLQLLNLYYKVPHFSCKGEGDEFAIRSPFMALGVKGKNDNLQK